MNLRQDLYIRPSQKNDETFRAFLFDKVFSGESDFFRDRFKTAKRQSLH